MADINRYRHDSTLEIIVGSLPHSLSYYSGSQPLKVQFYYSLVFNFSLQEDGLPWWLSGKESACNEGDAGDLGLMPGSVFAEATEHTHLGRYYIRLIFSSYWTIMEKIG